MKTLKEIFGGVVKKTESNNLPLNNEHEGVQYRCPMGCEGNKTYDSPGTCPVCNMKLVSVSDSGSPTGDHEHGHGHRGCC